MYAIVCDFDIESSKVNYPRPSWNNACDNVKRYLTVRGFPWMQGSTSFSVDAVRRVRGVQKLAKAYPWFTPSIPDIGMLRIEENSDLSIALDDD